MIWEVKHARFFPKDEDGWANRCTCWSLGMS